MGRKFSEKENELYQRSDEVLHYLWDPIGVSGAPSARDEYYSYLPHVYALLIEGANKEAIADFLGKVTSESIGLESNRMQELNVAEVLIRWREALLGISDIHHQGADVP